MKQFIGIRNISKGWEMIRLIKPYISFDEVEAEFRQIFESGWFTKGQFVQEFRQVLVDYFPSPNVFLTTSATTALSTCLKLLKVGAGDEVIVSDFSFPATSNVVEDVGAMPIFADVSLDTYNMLPEELEKKITERTKAVIFVDAFGNPTGIHDIKAICEANNLPLIEDAACAIGSSEAGLKCGTIADLTCFSFHPRKLLTTGEGGAISTTHSEWSEKLEVMLNHGAVLRDGKLDFVDYGYNYRMSELQAVMGIKQMLKIDGIVKQRQKVREFYIEKLTSLGFVPQMIGSNVNYNVQSLVFTVPESINRDSFISAMAERGVETTLGTYSLSNGLYNKKKYNSPECNSYDLQQNTITFPCYDCLDLSSVFSAVEVVCATGVVAK